MFRRGIQCCFIQWLMLIYVFLDELPLVIRCCCFFDKKYVSLVAFLANYLINSIISYRMVDFLVFINSRLCL
jgi:hypothetical protein